jgi:hypothetical protein
MIVRSPASGSCPKTICSYSLPSRSKTPMDVSYPAPWGVHPACLELEECSRSVADPAVGVSDRWSYRTIFSERLAPYIVPLTRENDSLRRGWSAGAGRKACHKTRRISFIGMRIRSQTYGDESAPGHTGPFRAGVKTPSGRSENSHNGPLWPKRNGSMLRPRRTRQTAAPGLGPAAREGGMKYEARPIVG